MTRPRFRLRSLMILILVTALCLGVGTGLSKLNSQEIRELQPWVIVLGGFILMVSSKLALLIAIRARRDQPGHSQNGDSPPTASNETATS